MSNSLGHISNINLDSFKTDATYYLSKSGEVKIAGMWFKFKLCLNIGNSRNKVRDLLNNVKAKMLSATNSASSIREFENSIKTDKYKVKLSALLQNFEASNAKLIHGEEVKKIAEEKISFIAAQIVCDNEETRQELKTFLFKSLCSFYNNPPLKNGKDGKGQVLDKKQLLEQTKSHLDQIKDDLMKKLKTGSFTHGEHLKLDSLYLNYYKKNLFKEDADGGLTRNDVNLDDIKPKKDAFADSLASNPALLKNEQFSEIAEHLKSVLDKTENGLLKNILTKSADRILVNGNGDLRTLDEVKEKIKNIENNFYDMKNNCTNATSEKIAGLFLNDVGIKKLKEGSAQKLFEMINSEAPKLFEGISENTSPKELSKLMENIQLTIEKITVETGILYDDDKAEDCKEAVRFFILGEMISNLSPDDQEKVINMTNSLSFAKVYTILDTYTLAVSEEQDFADDEELFKQLGQKNDAGRLLVKVMDSLNYAAHTVANHDKIYDPIISMSFQHYVGIDMNSKKANTVIENSGMNSDKFKNSVFLDFA